jgi:MFS transporter, DHA1 family, tetracycline resistance protein
MTLTNKLRDRQVKILFLILFTDMIGFGMSIPLFGILFGSANNQFYLGNILGINNVGLYFGIFTALYGLGQFIANPILGALSDSLGRKPVLSFAIFGTFLSRILFIIGLLRMNVFLMFISRFIDGGTGGIISLSNASITDTTEPNERGKYIGKTMAGFSLGGFVVGPILFTLFAYTGEYWSVVGPFVAATILSFIAFVLCILFFPETLDKSKIQKNINLQKLWSVFLHSLDNIKIVIKEKSLRPFFIAAGIFYLGFSAYTTFASQYLVAHYNLTTQLIGVYFLIAGIVMTVVQGFLAYKIVQRYSMKVLIFPVLTILSLVMITFGFTSSWILLFITAFFTAVFVSLSMVMIQTNLAQMKSENKGALMGAFSSVQVLAMAIAPVIAGVLSKFSLTLPFVMSAILIFMAGYLLKRL